PAAGGPCPYQRNNRSSSMKQRPRRMQARLSSPNPPLTGWRWLYAKDGRLWLLVPKRHTSSKFALHKSTSNFAIILYRGTAAGFQSPALLSQRDNLVHDFRLDFWVLVHSDVRDSQLTRQIDIHDLAVETLITRNGLPPARSLIIVDRLHDIGGNG